MDKKKEKGSGLFQVKWPLNDLGLILNANLDQNGIPSSNGPQIKVQTQYGHMDSKQVDPQPTTSSCFPSTAGISFPSLTYAGRSLDSPTVLRSRNFPGFNHSFSILK